MTAMETWNLDELYSFLRTCFPWHGLPRRSFDAVLDMLSGCFADTKIHELSPRVLLDRDARTVEAPEKVLPLLYSSGGTIPDRGYFQLRLAGSGELIGELDEEFVWERKLNEMFTLGNRTWRITGMNERTMEVVPVRHTEAMTPFWRAEPRGRSYGFCLRIREFFDTWPIGEEDEICIRQLEEHYLLEKSAAEELAGYLRTQATALGNRLPGTDRIILEYCGTGRQVVIHTFWGWEVNAPFALALSRALEERYGTSLTVFYTDACVLIDLPERIDRLDLPGLLPPERLPLVLRKFLESTGLFGALFRENAARALLIPRSTGRKRIPLWFSRLRGKSLYEAIAKYEDFPVLSETWRSCLEDMFDLPDLIGVLEEIADGRMKIERIDIESPSPFAADAFFQHTNYFMYLDDTPEAVSVSRLSDDYIRDLVFSMELRPRIPEGVIRAFGRRIQRLEPGYTPQTPALVLDLVRQRRFLTEAEWRDLLEAAARDHGFDPAELEAALVPRLQRFRFPPGTEDLIAVPSEAKKLSRLSAVKDLTPLVAERLSWFGPLSADHIRPVFGLTEELYRSISAELIEQGDAVSGPVGEKAEAGEICSPRSLEIMLRLKRRLSRTSFKSLPAEYLAPFLAQWSGLTREEKSSRVYEERIEQVLFYPAEAHLWEEDIFPARIPGYNPARLDSLLEETGLLWLGCGAKRLLFSFKEDLGLLQGQAGTEGLHDTVDLNTL